jgi:hypothetical protein
MPRLPGGAAVASSPSMSTRPPSGATKPAAMRSSVVLPQPDAPSSVTNSPGAIDSEIPSTARPAPYALLTVSNRSRSACL